MALFMSFGKLPTVVNSAAEVYNIIYLTSSATSTNALITEINNVDADKKLLINKSDSSLEFWRAFEEQTQKRPGLVLVMVDSEDEINQRLTQANKTTEEKNVVLGNFRAYLERVNLITDHYAEIVRRVNFHQKKKYLWTDIWFELTVWSEREARNSEREKLLYTFDRLERKEKLHGDLSEEEHSDTEEDTADEDTDSENDYTKNYGGSSDEG